MCSDGLGFCNPLHLHQPTKSRLNACSDGLIIIRY